MWIAVPAIVFVVSIATANLAHLRITDDLEEGTPLDGRPSWQCLPWQRIQSHRPSPWEELRLHCEKFPNSHLAAIVRLSLATAALCLPVLVAFAVTWDVR
jgi:hypothetical protein